MQLSSHDVKLGLCARFELQALSLLELPLDARLYRPGVFALEKRASLFKPLDPCFTIGADVACPASSSNGPVCIYKHRVDRLPHLADQLYISTLCVVAHVFLKEALALLRIVPNIGDVWSSDEANVLGIKGAAQLLSF